MRNIGNEALAIVQLWQHRVFQTMKPKAAHHTYLKTAAKYLVLTLCGLVLRSTHMTRPRV